MKSSCYNVNENQPSLDILHGWLFHIAVKELTIEWQDYQREFSGYIYCEACEDRTDESSWYKRIIEDSELSDPDQDKTKELLRFVKSPGLRTTNIKINKGDLEFFPIKLNKCKVLKQYHKEVMNGEFLEIRREHQLECEIRPLFDEKQNLPIKNAHITVEIYLKY